MPGFDGTGPMGAGPMTGRSFGRCGAGNGMNEAFGRGARRGGGCGRGWRQGAWGRGNKAGFGGSAAGQQLASATRIEDLALEARRLEEQLQLVRQRLVELKQNDE